ncbi:helix-turn-helix domain-containing protein [Chengkuizengella marina]|uniref:XRE family transcriptional regulator n=1 Tax=Chengkuizengella marina TaxID=2507566 RepID=A0A6N9PXR9_9BACL|nr:helix-turn-helix transcriptional regulator [Chengkuizengella marina]NBI28311.1 XRE family transcriptional regulator [Chengkuizengella marina]
MLGQRIKERRVKKGFTQEELAQRLDMKRPNFANYEANRTIPPSDVLSKLADILNTSTDYLLGKTNNPLPIDNERDFTESLELNDNSLLDKYSLTLDGKTLSEEQAKLAIAFLRTALRQNNND